MAKNSKQKIALVTGASKGIGKAIALRLSSIGYYVYVTYHSDLDGGKKTLKEISSSGAKGGLHKLDVRDESSVKSLMDKIDEEYGHLDLLVNNAVKELSKPIEEASLDDWKTVLSTKLDGAFLTTKYAIPLLKKSENPNLVNIATYEGERPVADFLAYGVANAGLIAFTKAMATYLPRYGIRVNAIMPGEVRTPLWGDGYNDDKLWKELDEANPMGRVAGVKDVADALILLTEDPNKFLNGNFLFVNGGKHLKP